jgi:hypothetical protein
MTKSKTMKLGASGAIVTIATIALCLLNTASAHGQGAPAKQLMSEQAFKNVTVL